MEINYADIGNRIRKQRKGLKITQEKLAEMTELSVQHMSGIENGKTKFSFQSILRIANALELSMDELLCGSLMQGKPVMQNEFANLLADCTAEETGLILSMAKALKKSLRPQ
ncbi:MAG: helix-turn-helix transcriptional regulator [Firmicutes bacterium]|nr:helix-turn-helix transcriptional regulator [Bacillota bacterium]